MELNLDQIGAMHPKLQLAGEAEIYQRRGALALARAQHAPGVVAEASNGAEITPAKIHWTASASLPHALAVIDETRLTEDGAEAVALAFVHARSGWQATRRVQRNGFADWLFAIPKRPKLALTLEVSGVGVGDADRRLKVKLAQVARLHAAGSIRAALVVSFMEPRILAATISGEAIP